MRRSGSARDQAHTTIEGAGHFLQEQAGEELARVIVEFITARCPQRSIDPLPNFGSDCSRLLEGIWCPTRMLGRKPRLLQHQLDV